VLHTLAIHMYLPTYLPTVRLTAYKGKEVKNRNQHRMGGTQMPGNTRLITLLGTLIHPRSGEMQFKGRNQISAQNGPYGGVSSRVEELVGGVKIQIVKFTGGCAPHGFAVVGLGLG